ncbi:hypothetical protein [Nostoc spongiaeforme]|nr:hypothetical protein [Nostoc spongiaeforme]
MKIHSNLQYLSLILGQKLKNILVLNYCGNEDINYSSIHEIQLKFEELKSLRLFCGVDGSSICWDNSELQAISMGEHGELRICNLLGSDTICKNLFDKKLEKIYLVTSEREDCIFSLKFVFANALELFISNIGDDLKLQEQLPIETIQEEKSQFLDIHQIDIDNSGLK